MITSEGIILDPRYLEGLLALPSPTTAAEVDQFKSASNWIRVGSTDCTPLTFPLQEFLTTQKGLHGCRIS